MDHIAAMQRSFDAGDRQQCSCAGCAEPVTAFRHFPTVVGYCIAHGNVLANFLSFIDAPGIVGFDAQRARWENIIRLRQQTPPDRAS